MKDKLLGNRYSWSELTKALTSKIVPVFTDGSAMKPGILDYVDGRRKAAMIANDQKELDNLDHFYGGANKQTYIVENPVKVDGKTLFCYLSREDGFICPDAELTDKKYTFRELLAKSDVPVVKIKSHDHYDDVVTAMEDDEGLVVDFMPMGKDFVAIIGSEMAAAALGSILSSLGFPETKFSIWAAKGYTDGDGEHPDEEIWENMWGAAMVNSPLMVEPAVIPIGDTWAIMDAVNPPDPRPVDHYTIVPIEKITNYALDFDNQPAMAIGPGIPFKILYDREPLTQEQRDGVTCRLMPGSKVGGRVTGVWNGDGVYFTTIELECEVKGTDWWQEDVYVLFEFGNGETRSTKVARTMWFNRATSRVIRVNSRKPSATLPDHYDYQLSYEIDGVNRLPTREFLVLDEHTKKQLGVVVQGNFIEVKACPVDSVLHRVVFNTGGYMGQFEEVYEPPKA